MSVFNCLASFRHAQQAQDIARLRANSVAITRIMFKGRRDLKGRVQDLEGRVGELALLCHGLLEALRAQGGLDEDLLRQAMERIDLEDGRADGKAAPRRKARPQ